MLEQQIYEYLLTVDDLADLVEDRIFPLRRTDKEKILPAITYARSGRESFSNLSGSTSMDHATIEMTVYASTYLEAKEVATELRTAMFSLDVDDSCSAKLDDESDAVFDPFDGSDDAGAYTVTQTWKVMNG